MAYIGRDIQYGVLDKQSFTANSSTTAFTLDSGVKNAKSLLVSIGGIIQEPDVAYTASGTTLTFTTAPATGMTVYAIYLGKTLESGGARDQITFQNETGDGTTTPFTLSAAPVNAQSIMVTLNGVTQVPGTDYTVAGTTITFTTAPANGMGILVYHLGSAAAIGEVDDASITDAKIVGMNASKLTGTLAANTVPNSSIVTMDAAKLTGSLPSSMEVDTTAIDQTIASLGMHVAVADNKASFNLPGVFIDQFESDTGILTETTVDRDTTGEYVSSIYSTSTVTTPASASDWTGGTGNYDFTSGGVDATGGDKGVYSDWVSGTGDFEIEFTLTGWDYGGNIGVFAVSEVGTFNGNLSTGGLHNMTNAFHVREYNQTVWKGGTSLGGLTITDGSVVKIVRTSGVITFVDDGNTEYTWSGTNNDSLHFFVGSDGSPHNIDIDSLTFTATSAPSTNATGTLISTASTADAATTTASGVMVYENSDGTATLGTDLKAYFSADDGANWTEAASYGSTINFNGASKKLVKLGKTTGLTSGTQMKLKAEWANQAATVAGSAAGYQTGDRTSTITITSSHSGNLVDGSLANWVNGNDTQDGTNSWYWDNNGTVSGRWIQFDFGSGQTITEMRYTHSGNNSGGVWQWQGSNDASSWTDIGATWEKTNGASNAAGTETITTMSGNTTSYRYYRMLGVSGTTSNPWNREIEFKHAEVAGVTGKETRLHGWAINY